MAVSSPTRERKPQPFNYTNALWEVVRDVVATLEELRHVELDRVLLATSQARQASKHGVYAACVPLRFENGAQETVIRKRRWKMPAVRHEGRDMLYLLYFMLPRFATIKPTPMMEPDTDASINVITVSFHPRNAPTIASIFTSPMPSPSCPRRR